MTQFKFLTSWYQVPIKDCLEGMKPYLFDYANKEFFIYSAVNKTSYSIVTIGFYKEDKEFSNPIVLSYTGLEDEEFSNPIVLSYTGLEDEEFSVFCNELKEQSEYYNLYLPTPNFKQGESFCCHELTDYFKEVLFRRYINGE